MQAFSNTTKYSHYMPECPEDIREDEGFAEEEIQSLIIPKPDIQDDFSVTKPRSKHKVIYREPKIKLVYVTKQKDSKQIVRKSIIQKQAKFQAGKSLEFPKRQSRKSLQAELLAECVTRIKRAYVGQNITIPIFGFVDSKAVKSHILTSGGTLVYEKTKEINTHGFIRKYSQNQSNKLLQNDFNQLLKIKLHESFVMPKKKVSLHQGRSISFQGDYQAANLQFVSEISEKQYQVFLRNDTNTHGHQSWFLFKIHNNKAQSQTITIHICNIKRNLIFFNQGAKIYKRKIDHIQDEFSQWQTAGENIQFKASNNPKFANYRVYKLSFSLTLEPEEEIEIALLPSYTYTDLMNQIKSMSACEYLTVETLTYSLVGFAIPILTFTRGDNPNKNVILVSCRVHPGQTNSSFMCRGLMKWLAHDSIQSRDFLEKYIVKIIPMINPDGVIFGNFRTNFLGADLNRSFDSQDQITNPQVCALKELGLKLKDDYGQRFNIFIDLHGHSSQKNIFSYGPDYQTTQTNFYQVRLLPKILNLRSKMFKYSSCTFKLEDYKKYTARGFFLNTVGILAYTVEASYAFYQDQGKIITMNSKEWTEFGINLGESLALLVKINKISTIRNRSDIKKALGEADKQQLQIIKKFKREFKHEKQNTSNVSEKKKEKNGEDSDGEAETQDYNRVERDELLRRVSQTMAPSMVLPRVLKPSIVYPTVTPKLFKYRQQFEQSNLKILYTKRSYKYSGMRMPGNSFIHSLKGLQLSKPQAKPIYS